MFDSMLYFWLCLGALLVFAEVILPGLVSVFVGMGALTVASLLYFHQIEHITEQLVVWFASSTLYIFSIRLLVMRYYPMDTEVQNINEDQEMIGQVVKVSETIPADGSGRIEYGDTTWTAMSINDEEIQAGNKVRITGRNNISVMVKKI